MSKELTRFRREIEFLRTRGWWIQISPLARLEPEEWLLAVYKRGKKAWITEVCKSGFKSPSDAYEWAYNFIVAALRKR